jgi:ribose 1,5-bisphosphokinase
MAKLFFIVGNSGSGKDSLIRYVQKNFPSELKSVKVPIRVITRPPSPETEDFESVTVEQFQKLKNNGAFVLDWFIYELYYGVRKEIDEWMAGGHPVLINVSRNIIESAKSRYPNLKIVFVRVPIDVTTKRIKDRGRENEESMKERMERASKMQDQPDADFIVDNSGDLEAAGKVLLNYIVEEYKKDESIKDCNKKCKKKCKNK